MDALYAELLAANAAHLERFLAAEMATTNPTPDPMTWEPMQQGFAPIGMHAYEAHEPRRWSDSDQSVRPRSRRRRVTMIQCDEVISTLDEAIKAIAADSSGAYHRLERELIGGEVVAGADVLETLHPRTKERPDAYIGLKHVTYRSAVDLGRHADVFAGEDYVLLETSGRAAIPTATSTSGSASREHDSVHVAYKMLRSVDGLPGEIISHLDTPWPQDHENDEDSSPHSHRSRARRGHIHTYLLVLTETPSTHGRLRMQLWLDIDLPADDALASSFSSLHDALSLGLRYRRHIERSFAAAVRRDPHSNMATHATECLLPLTRGRVAQCQVCERKLGLLAHRRRHACDVCRASLCGTCTKTTEVVRAWRLCACCYGRNHGLFSRQIVASASRLSRISFFARRAASHAGSSLRDSLLGHGSRHEPRPSHWETNKCAIFGGKEENNGAGGGRLGARRQSSGLASSQMSDSSGSTCSSSEMMGISVEGHDHPLGAQHRVPGERHSRPAFRDHPHPLHHNHHRHPPPHATLTEMDEITKGSDRLGPFPTRAVSSASSTWDARRSSGSGGRRSSGVRLLDEAVFHRLSGPMRGWSVVAPHSGSDVKHDDDDEDDDSILIPKRRSSSSGSRPAIAAHHVSIEMIEADLADLRKSVTFCVL